MNLRTTIAIITIAVIMATAPAAQAATACEILLTADQDADGKVTSLDALMQLQAGNTANAILILQAAAAGSINALIPGCYQEPFMVEFSDEQAGTYLYEEEMGIHIALPATVELKGHLPEYYGYIDYTFEIHPEEDSTPTEDALMFFAIRACPDELYCQWVDFAGEGCGQTTPPGVVVTQGNRTVEIYSPPV
jgi:hypothetical protein